MNCIKCLLPVGEMSNGGGVEVDQSALYACMEKSQWNPFVQLTYTN
jgi:hypothetical protein